MAAHTLAPHHGGVAVGEHHRARGGVFARRGAADLSRGRAGRLHLDRRAHARRENPDRAAVPARARGVRVGAAGGPRRSPRGPRRGPPARALGRDPPSPPRPSPAPREIPPPPPPPKTQPPILSPCPRAR